MHRNPLNETNFGTPLPPPPLCPPMLRPSKGRDLFVSERGGIGTPDPLVPIYMVCVLKNAAETKYYLQNGQRARTRQKMTKEVFDASRQRDDFAVGDRTKSNKQTADSDVNWWRADSRFKLALSIDITAMISL